MNDEENAYSILSLLASNILATQTKDVKIKFYNCITKKPSVSWYARCLIRLSRTAKIERQNSFGLLDKKSIYDADPKYDTLTRLDSVIQKSKFIDRHDRVSNGTLPPKGGVLSFLTSLFCNIANRYGIFGSGGKDSSIRILSPRFMPIFDNKDNDISILSPDVFSFYDNQSKNNFLSLPKILETLPVDEQQMWLKFLYETIGSFHDHASKSTWESQITNLWHQEGLDNVSTRSQIRHLFHSFTRHQIDELGSRGFSFLDREQAGGYFGQSFDSGHYSNIEINQEKLLWEAVGNMARGFYGQRAYDEMENAGFINTRKKRQIPRTVRAKGCFMKPSLGAKVSHVNFLITSVLFCPSAVGYFTQGSLILSPMLFSPKVLFPFTLSALILSPSLFTPRVLSPAILCAMVLSPATFNPMVLSPVILTPFVLNPVIMSPGVLNPPILSPKVLSPVVMSPGVLSPPILSPCVLC